MPGSSHHVASFVSILTAALLGLHGCGSGSEETVRVVSPDPPEQSPVEAGLGGVPVAASSPAADAGPVDTPGTGPLPDPATETDGRPDPADGNGGNTTTAELPCGGADIVCDDFEADTLGSHWAFTGDPSRQPILDSSRAYSGNTSLTFASADTRGAFIYPAAGLPTEGNSYFVRARVQLARPMSEMNGHVSFMVGADRPENGVELRLGASRNFASGEIMLDLNLMGAGSELTQFSNGDVTGGEGTSRPGESLQADRWYCIEAHFNGAGSTFQLWVDGNEVTGLHVTDWQGERSDPWSPLFSHAKIGVQNYSGDIGQVWYDDIAIGSGPIGCD